MSSVEQEYYISIGNSCAVSYQLQQLNLRQLAFPFDWLLTPKLGKIIELIDNQFIDLFNKEYLATKNYSHHFPYLVGEQWVDKEKDKSEQLTLRVNQTKYGIGFVHDFTSLEDLPQVALRYHRRIDRFYEIMRNENIKKKVYRISPLVEQISDLEKCFIRNGFRNFEIFTQTYSQLGVSTDWKFDNYHWKEWFVPNQY